MLKIHRTELNGHPLRSSREAFQGEANAYPSVGPDQTHNGHSIPATFEAVSAYALTLPPEPTSAPAVPVYSYTRGELLPDLVTYEAVFDLMDQPDAEYFVIAAKLQGGDFAPVLPVRVPGKITIYLPLLTESVLVTAVNGAGETPGSIHLF